MSESGFIPNESPTAFETEVYNFAKAMGMINLVTTNEFNILSRKLRGVKEKHVFLKDSNDEWIFVAESKVLNNLC